MHKPLHLKWEKKIVVVLFATGGSTPTNIAHETIYRNTPADCVADCLYSACILRVVPRLRTEYFTCCISDVLLAAITESLQYSSCWLR